MRENGESHASPEGRGRDDAGKPHGSTRRWHGGSYLGEAPATVRQELSIGGWGRGSAREPYGPPCSAQAARQPTEH